MNPDASKPLTINDIRVIVREEIAAETERRQQMLADIRAGKPVDAFVNYGDQPTALDNRPANCRFRLQDEGKPYPRSSCAACGRTITTGLGKSCATWSGPTKPTSVDDLVRVIKAEFTRQGAADGTSPYVDIVGRTDDTAVLDGEFDLRALATAILAG